ncbi:hypothetical protein [Clostridium butyricum]
MGNKRSIECGLSENKADLLNIIVGIMFRRLKEKIDKDLPVLDKKNLLEKFEAVIKCLRRRELGIKNLYEKQEDNIEVLIELSETFDIKEKFEELIYEYKKKSKEEMEIDENNHTVTFTYKNANNEDESTEYNLLYALYTNTKNSGNLNNQ